MCAKVLFGLLILVTKLGTLCDDEDHGCGLEEKMVTSPSTVALWLRYLEDKHECLY